MSIKLHSGQTINYFKLNGIVDTDDTINNTTGYDDNFEWLYNTILFAPFNNSLNAGSISDLSELLESWRIYRRRVSSTQNELAGEVSSTINSIKDYCISNSDSYIYQIIGVTENYTSDIIESDVISTNFLNWSLTGISSHDVFKFRLNVNEGNITVNSNVSIVINNSRYPVTNKSPVKYKSGNPNALIGDLHSDGITYIDTIELREKLIDFLNNDEQKLLKTPKGDVFLVDTYTNDYSVENRTHEKIQTINFSWVEVGNIDNVSVFDEMN